MADHSSPSARIQLSGPLLVELDGRRVEARLPGRKGRLLFAFLALNRARPVSRDELIEALWPDDRPASPEAGLSTLLARLRRALGEGVVVGRQQITLALGPDAVIDVEVATARTLESECSVDAGDAAHGLVAAREALELVRRPLLPGLDARWLEDRRREIADLEPQLLETIASACLALGGSELVSAERAAKALLEREPFRESAYALLMKTHARRGNVAEALRVFDRLRLLLGEELGAVPTQEVMVLHERLLRSEDVDLAPAGTAPDAADAPSGSGWNRRPQPWAIDTSGDGQPFVGREEPLARLRERWDDCVGGARRLVLLVGEPGAGKTRLASHFAADVQPAGTLLYGRCDEEVLLPYQPFLEPLRHYLTDAPNALGDLQDDARELARLVPDLVRQVGEPPEAASNPQAQRYTLFEAVRAVLCHATRGRPLLLVLDDLHWADKPTLLLLRHLMRHHEPSSLMVLGLFRDVEVSLGHPLIDTLAHLRREDRFERIVLSGLSDTDTAALVAASVPGDATPGFIRKLTEATEGNPFFIGETLRSLAESEVVAGEPAAWEGALERMGVPEGVEEVITRRLGRLSPPALQALAVAAVVGRDFRLGVLEDLLDVPAEAVISALEEAITAGLVVETPQRVDEFSFSHVLVRETIYAQRTRSRRLRLHLQVGEALERRPAREDIHPAEIAHHLFLARELAGPEKTLAHTLRAAERAVESLAYEEAAGQYRRALEVIDDQEQYDEQQRCDVLLDLGRVLWQAGDAQARETYWEAAVSARDRQDPAQLACAALGVGERFWEVNIIGPKYRGLLEEALATLTDEHEVLRARVMARLAENLHFKGEEQRGEALSRDAAAIARRAGDQDVLLTTLMARHVALLHIEHLEERLRLMTEIEELSIGQRGVAAEGRQWHLYDLFELGDFDSARLQQNELDRLAEELRQPLFRQIAVGWQGVWAQLDGDVEQAELLAHAAFEHGRRARALDAGITLAASLLLIRREQGRAAELLPLLDAAIQSGSAVGPCRAARAVVYLESGNEQGAQADYEAFSARRFETVPRDWYWLTTVALLAEVCAGLGDAARAPVLYEMLLPFAARNVQMSFAGFGGPVAYFLGILAATNGDVARAISHFDAALEFTRGAGASLFTARTQVAAGRLLLEGVDPRAADDRLTEAWHSTRELGLERLTNRIATLR